MNGVNADLIELNNELNQLIVNVGPSSAINDGVFLGGSGMKYQRYDLSTVNPSCSEFKTTLDTTSDYDDFLVDDKYISEPKTENVYGSQYG